ncbi:MAG TPA: diguanylate cyclase [Mycobacteriales bacterium]|nr:diguanylate cyclase [Mycobacteriales bacterium]
MTTARTAARPIVPEQAIPGNQRRGSMPDAIEATPDFYEQLLEAAPDGIVVVDDTGTILLANRKAEALFGWPRDELLGKSLETLVPHRARPSHPTHRSGYMQDPRNRPMGSGLELTALRADGSEFPVDISLSPLVTEVGTYVSAAVRDATDRKQTELELRAANTRLRDAVSDLEGRSRDMAALSRASQVMQSCSRLDEALQVIARAAAGLFEGVPGGVYVLNDERGLLESAAIWAGLPPSEPFRPEDCWALRTGHVHLLGDDELALPCNHVPHPTEWAVCVPLVAQSEMLGVVHLLAPESRPEPGYLHRVQEIATLVRDQWSLTLANLRLRDTLRDQSIRDPLTGLFNRRFLDEFLDRELQRARRRGHAVTLGLLDLDHFKLFNDTHGHHGGDTVLRDLGRYLLEGTRGEDVVARFGGEEFVVVMPDTNVDDGMVRIAALAEGWRHRCADGGSVLQPFPTISIGVADYPTFSESAHELLGAADRALYRAKQDGRDRLVLAGTTA